MTVSFSRQIGKYAGSIAIMFAMVGVKGADAQTVVPLALATTEGNGNNIFPFQTPGYPPPSLRYQQLFTATEFGALGGPVFITHVNFRPDADFGVPFGIGIASIQINLSTTTAVDDGLSTTFAANIGSDDAVVFAGPLTLTSAMSGPPGGPKDFDYVITLQTPFLYDPSAGSLLLDVRNLSGALASGGFDANFAFGDGVSRVFSNPYIGQDATVPVGFADTLGLVAQFVTTPAALPVVMDIKPGGVPNSINSRSTGRIPVAILSTSAFNAPSRVNVTSLTFGRTGSELSLSFCNTSSDDVNSDGLPDLMCHFKTEATGFLSGDAVGVLKGSTVDGLSIQGSDSVNIVK
jgi:hypothetical protein